MEELLKELSIQYKNYESYLELAMPHFERKKLDIGSLKPPPKKKTKKNPPKKKTEKNPPKKKPLTTFHEIIYSSIGSAIKDGTQREFVQKLIDKLFYSTCKLQRKSSFCTAVALLQLLQDADIINSFAVPGKNPRVGCWFKDILENFDGKNPIFTTLKKPIKYHTELEQMSYQLVHSLLSKICAIDIDKDNIDFITKFNEKFVAGINNFTLPEFGFLLLCFKNSDIVTICTYPEFARCFLGDTELVALSELFIPIRYSSARISVQKWISSKDYFIIPAECLGGDDASVWQSRSDGFKYTLIRISTKDMLLRWAISMLCSNCFELFQDRTTEHVLDLQLVIDNLSGFPCVSIDEDFLGPLISDKIDAVWMEGYNQPAYHFTSTHLAIYLRMFYYLNPYYRPPPLNKSYFISTDDIRYNYSKMFFIPKIPELYRSKHLCYLTEDKIKTKKQKKISKINDYISAYAIYNQWIDCGTFLFNRGYDKDAIEDLFGIGKYINKEEIISKGAKYITSILDVDFIPEKPFEKFSQKKEEGIEQFDKYFKHFYTRKKKSPKKK